MPQNVLMFWGSRHTSEDQLYTLAMDLVECRQEILLVWNFSQQTIPQFIYFSSLATVIIEFYMCEGNADGRDDLSGP